MALSLISAFTLWPQNALQLVQGTSTPFDVLFCLQCGKHGFAWTCVAPLKELESRGITYDADAKQMVSVHHEATDLSAQQV